MFRCARGQAHGGVVLDFAGNGAAAGDRLVLTGYGTAAQGASFVHLTATTWQVTSAEGLADETIVFANGAVLA